MHVLGQTNGSVKPVSFDAVRLQLYTAPKSSFPEVFCPIECGISVQIIIYHRPSPIRMQYMSLDPISLVLAEKSLHSGPGFDGAKDSSRQHLIRKLRLHTVVRHVPSQKELLLPLLMRQINCSYELAHLMSKNVKLIGTRQRRKLSVSQRVVESATSFWDYLAICLWHMFSVWLYPILTRTFIIGLICHRFIAEIILRLLNWRLRHDSAALKDISATAQQIDIRLQQFCYWPIQYITLRKRKDDWDSVTERHPDYIRFYNSLWLVANDVIIGIALGSYIIDNAEWVAQGMNSFLTDWTVQGLKGMIVWLTDWPAGLKLNTELASFLGDLFLWVIEHWSRKSKFLYPALTLTRRTRMH